MVISLGNTGYFSILLFNQSPMVVAEGFVPDSARSEQAGHRSLRGPCLAFLRRSLMPERAFFNRPLPKTPPPKKRDGLSLR